MAFVSLPLSTSVIFDVLIGAQRHTHSAASALLWMRAGPVTRKKRLVLTVRDRWLSARERLSPESPKSRHKPHRRNAFPKNVINARKRDADTLVEVQDGARRSDCQAVVQET